MVNSSNKVMKTHKNGCMGTIPVKTSFKHLTVCVKYAANADRTETPV